MEQKICHFLQACVKETYELQFVMSRALKTRSLPAAAAKSG